VEGVVGKIIQHISYHFDFKG